MLGLRTVRLNVSVAVPRLPFAVGLACLLACAETGLANSIVGEFNWNDGLLQGWSDSQAWTDLANPGSGGVGGSGYLSVSFPTVADQLPPPTWYALPQVNASTLFAGNWDNNMWVQFDFFAKDIQPQYVQVRWAATTNRVWRSTVFDSDIQSMQTNTWTTLRSSTFQSYADWNYGGGSQEQFVTDLASIDWIGVYIFRNTSAAQDYGIDDFRLMVPEPSQILMLLGCTVSAFLTLRKRKGDQEAA